VGDDIADGFGAGGVGSGVLDAAVGGAGAPGDDGLGVLGGFLEDVEETLAVDGAVDAAVLSGRVALDSQQVAAL